ncbi:MAG TPA: spore germination protein [Eubacteriaceae bacterium]|jgi:spore germination protein KA|nr:spore germination protein [Eubacteriaceae bacterium]
MIFRRNGNKKIKHNNIFYDELPDSIDAKLNTQTIKSLLGDGSDVECKTIFIGDNRLPITIIFIDGLADQQLISDFILKPLMEDKQFKEAKNIKKVIELVEDGYVYFSSQEKRLNIKDVILDILSGNTALIFDIENTVFTFDTKGFEKRAISEPTGENIIKGAKDSFVENLRTNTATIRKKLKTHKLMIKDFTIGKESNTKIAIVYIKGIGNENIVKILKERLDNINIDGVLTTGVIEENIIDNKYSVFPQVIYTERPDKFCANVIEGRIGLIIDGFPITYIVPVTIGSFLQAPEDYAYNYFVSSVIRFLRFFLMFTTLLLPGFYISIATFHHEMIPTQLALAITASKEGVPFPTFVEVIFLQIAFEILTEAGLRLPQNIGQVVSIVGAVVIGQAAVEANLVSPVVLIIVAVTAISNFTMPNQDFSNALRVWRILFVLLSSIIGLFGLSLASIILLHHLSNMEVYGIPYLVPFVGEEGKQLQDSIFRLPFSTLYKRPIGLKTINKKRQD